MLYCDMSYNDIFPQNALLVKSHEFLPGVGCRLRVDGFKQRKAGVSAAIGRLSWSLLYPRRVSVRAT